jgi:hypothetical protein
VISPATHLMGRLDTLQVAANEISRLAVTTTDLETKIQLRRVASSIDSQVLLLRRELDPIAHVIEGRRMDLEDIRIESGEKGAGEVSYRCQCWNIKHKTKCINPAIKICKVCADYLCGPCAKNHHVHTEFQVLEEKDKTR